MMNDEWFDEVGIYQKIHHYTEGYKKSETALLFGSAESIIGANIVLLI